jgi:hypothetical protein
MAPWQGLIAIPEITERITFFDSRNTNQTDEIL